MDVENRLQQAEALLQPLAGAMLRKEDNRLDAVVELKNLKAAVKLLADTRWGYLMAISFLDHPVEEGQDEGVIEVIYFFASGAAVTGLRVVVPYSKAAVPSICDIFPNATLYERELMEMMGVDVEGTPVRDRLVLSDDWPEGIYPLRKSFISLDKASA